MEHIARCDPQTIAELIRGYRIGIEAEQLREFGKSIGEPMKDGLAPAYCAVYARASFLELCRKAFDEAERAMVRFPQPNYVISKFAEESGEVVKAAIHCAEGRETHQAVAGEMKQAIAMLYRLWVEGDGVHGLERLYDRQAQEAGQ